MRTLALTFLALTLASPTLAQRGDEVWRGTLADGAWLGAVTPNGEIHVTGTDGATATVRAEVRRGDASRVTFDVLEDDGRVTVCAITPAVRTCDHESLNTRSVHQDERIVVDLYVSLPRGARIRASSGNGDLVVNAAAAEARASSGNGSVEVSRVAGPVHASTGNGAVRLADVGGPVRASTGNGRIEVDAVRGPVRASTGNGNVRVSMSELSEAADMRFSSGNGSIEVTLPPSYSGDVTARTGSGRIESDFAVEGRGNRLRLQGIIGGGGPSLQLSTGRGDIEIRRGR